MGKANEKTDINKKGASTEDPMDLSVEKLFGEATVPNGENISDSDMDKLSKATEASLNANDADGEKLDHTTEEIPEPKKEPVEPKITQTQNFEAKYEALYNSLNPKFSDDSKQTDLGKLVTLARSLPKDVTARKIVADSLRAVKKQRIKDKETVEELRDTAGNFEAYKRDNNPKLADYNAIKEQADKLPELTEELRLANEDLTNRSHTNEEFVGLEGRMNAITTPLNVDRSKLTGVKLLSALYNAIPADSAAQADMKRALKSITGKLKDNKKFRDNFKWLNLPVPEDVSSQDILINIYNNIPDTEDFSILREHLSKHMSTANAAFEKASKYDSVKEQADKSHQILYVDLPNTLSEKEVIAKILKTLPKDSPVKSGLLRVMNRTKDTAQKNVDKIKSLIDYKKAHSHSNDEYDTAKGTLREAAGLLKDNSIIALDKTKQVLDLRGELQNYETQLNPDLSGLSDLAALTKIHDSLADGTGAKIGLKKAVEELEVNLKRQSEEYNVIEKEAESARTN